ncbi:hypothetical protein Cgig2_025553 [Carnegiea gigantea]|uniref:Uncharacterized protein n=1 Tax=Carnegiea gigantea TaxID=171969 RepID=A0A9Q1GI89_9CARY|nr:hypothetical protein Cgig2_025553 [Carnegiea gigantea]
MGFASFLNVDLKQIPRKFSTWLVDSLNVCNMVQTSKWAKCAYRGRKIIEITKSSTDKEYDEVNPVWLKEWKINQNALELTSILEFIMAKKDGGKSFKKNFIIYSRIKELLLHKSVLKYVKDEEQPLKFEGEALSEKRMHQKVFITRRTTHPFSSLVAQLIEAQTEAVRSMRFTSFNLNQMLVKFSKWLGEHKYETGRSFSVITFDVYITVGVPFEGTLIVEITKSSMDEEYDEKIDHSAPELTQIPEFILAKKDEGESFKRNFIVYLVNCFFNRAKNRYCSKSILKYVKDVNRFASLNWCQFVLDKLISSVRHY